MNSQHRLIIGALFILHGLVRVGLGFLVLSVNVEFNFSAVMITFAMAVPSLFGGYNLLIGNASAHSIMPIAAVINLFDLPIGTALSVYYYWFWKYQCGSPHPLKPDNNATPAACGRG